MKISRSRYFHSNLQNCSDIGRSAFLEAQATMNTIREVAARMVQDGGSVANIIELLENPEIAQYLLPSEIKAIRDSAGKCLKNVQDLTDRFQYWYWVICCLKSNVLAGQGKRRIHCSPFQQPEQ